MVLWAWGMGFGLGRLGILERGIGFVVDRMWLGFVAFWGLKRWEDGF